MRCYVFDASAVVDYLQTGAGSSKVERLLTDAFRQQLLLCISVLNLAEVYYLIWQRTGEEKARQTIASFSRLPIRIVPVELPQALKAGELKARHKIPYVDCIAAALAMMREATLVTSDRDFERLGQRVQILWLPR